MPLVPETSVLLLSTPATSLLLDGVCWNGAISACEKASLAQAAARLLRGMGHAGIRPDTISDVAATPKKTERRLNGLWAEGWDSKNKTGSLTADSKKSCGVFWQVFWRLEGVMPDPTASFAEHVDGNNT